MTLLLCVGALPADTGKKLQEKWHAASASLQSERLPVKMVLFFGKHSAGKSEPPSFTKTDSPVKGKFARFLSTALSRLTARIGASFDQIHLLQFVHQNLKKIVFLFICIVVIGVSLSCYRKRYEGKRFMTTTRLSIMDKEVQRACRYIEDNYRDRDLGLSSICNALVTGEAFLEALFEKELGLTLESFVNQVRINRVKIVLHHTPAADADDLAKEVGYRDGAEMVNVFKTVCQCEFADYCKALSEGHSV